MVGRIAALNSASDLFALGAKPIAALALITIPVGRPRQQEQLLIELLAGALDEFRKMGATLVGGHTIEGPQLTVGFTMLADQGAAPPRTKASLRPGDVLVLTKPIGSGVLLAAHMRAQCRAEWFDALLPNMLASNQAAAELVDEFDIQGLTDVTGFGLAGHLLEMLRASGLSAELNLQQIPLLPGAAELIAAGVASTLAPANRAAEAAIEVAETLRARPQFAALFDPQTCGGLLMGVSAEKSVALVERLRAIGHAEASVIGLVGPHDKDEPWIRLTSAG